MNYSHHDQVYIIFKEVLRQGLNRDFYGRVRYA